MQHTGEENVSISETILAKILREIALHPYIGPDVAFECSGLSF